MSKRVAAQEAFKLALSMALMFWLALWMNWDMPGNGGLAILLVSLGTAGASFNKGVLRVVGTTFGVAIGFLAVGLFGQSPWGTLIFFTLYLLVVGYMMQMTAANYAFYVAGFVPLMVWSSSYGSGEMGNAAFHYGSFRYLETSTGILIYTVVSILIWPIRAGDGLRGQGKALWTAARESFGHCRTVLTGGAVEADPAAQRATLDGMLTKFTATLQAAYGDTSSARRQKELWEVMRVNLRGLVDALDLWATSVGDCREFGAVEHLHGLEAGLEHLDQRFERIVALWAGAKESPDDDTELLAQASVTFVPGGGDRLSRTAAAAAESFVMQWKLLDRITCELLRGARVLAGLDAAKNHQPVAIAPDRQDRVLWDPARFVKALFPAICFAASFLFWILVDPPGGTSIPSTTGAIVLNYVLFHMNARMMVGLLFLGLWVCVAPIYFWVMPALETGSALLALIFLYTFLFGYLGASKPIFKMVPILMFVNMTGISNQQSYSFMALMNGALLFLFCFGIIAVIDILWTPGRPEQVLTGALQRFFRGCAGVVDGFAPDHQQGETIRQRYFDTMMRDTPGQVLGATNVLAGKKLGGCDQEAGRALVDGLQAITLRLQAVDLAHRQLGSESQEWRKEFERPVQELRELLRKRLLGLSLLGNSDGEPDQDPDLLRISKEIENRLNAEPQGAPRIPPAFHAMLGSVRGLLGAIGDTRIAMRRFDWTELSKVKFS